jgi:hypothetical protein
MPEPSLFFLTDAPPLRENAIGNHGIACNFVDILRDRVKLVITHRLRRALDTAQTRACFRTPIAFYPDGSGLGIRRLSGNLSEAMDLFGAWLFSWRLRFLAKKLRPSRTLVLVGANGWFLLAVRILTRAAKAPFDIYLVDDLEDSAVLAGRRFLPRVIRRIEDGTLRRAARIFAISPGYAEHLGAKYGVRAEWLPIPIQIDEFRHSPFIRRTPDVRRLVFAGSVNELYIPALVEIYGAIVAHNATEQPYRLMLTVVTPVSAGGLTAHLGNREDLEVITNPAAAELRALCAGAWATLLPYSFAPGVRKLVSTSFSSKLADSYRSGRPILVYGPEYASIPRYFREAGLPLCATSREDLPAAIAAIERHDGPELIRRYEATWRRFHSPEAILGRLGLSDQAARSEA